MVLIERKQKLNITLVYYCTKIIQFDIQSKNSEQVKESCNESQLLQGDCVHCFHETALEF